MEFSAKLTGARSKIPFGTREDGSKVEPPKEWFTIDAIIRDLELPERDWAAHLTAKMAEVKATFYK